MRFIFGQPLTLFKIVVTEGDGEGGRIANLGSPIGASTLVVGLVIRAFSPGKFLQHL
ncbi:hypothetical protein HanPI659440_Chr11g0420311 [Helianthus annuus]|nr:hypothetical protein HanPI659440_Chr11g0420311 [Helianthus annuus]